MSTFAVVIERAGDGGYGAWSPGLPGRAALGRTRADALEEMGEAVSGCPEVLRERGEPVPAPAAVAATELSARRPVVRGTARQACQERR
ncbi:type II toxin-antitoxin system HicB family antitoxin [Nocardiopsis akebiae]|uniref:Type II toxin-antitoxin system HicB family antitoxin n=1 Tax=Nocardiopsis akebiae TaxID=2831968 RepID=A0ABX8C8G2_9ACTN|nr:type II toxin-antitoxin system HicB family antitoxin [Nocardiopsis akebiae]QUX30175.1 type II toxin-antitoxin system HicB family antitoxin [Nocardiopsis akebiae]